MVEGSIGTPRQSPTICPRVIGHVDIRPVGSVWLFEVGGNPPEGGRRAV